MNFKMASDDEEEDLDALRNAVFASMKRKPPIPDNSPQVHQPVLSISNPEKRTIAKPQSYGYYVPAASNFSQQGVGRKPPFGGGRAGNTNLIVINTGPDKDEIEPSRLTANSGPVFIDRRLEKRAPGMAITSHSSTPPRPKATGKFSRFDSSSSESEDSSSDNDDSDKDSSVHSDSADDDPPEISFNVNESSDSDSKSRKSSELSEGSDEESHHNAPVLEKSPQINSNAVKLKAITPSPKEKFKNDSSVRYVVPPSSDLLSDKSVCVTVKRSVSCERKSKSRPDDRRSEIITKRISTERKAVNSLKQKRAPSPEKIKPDNSSDKSIKPLMSNKELTTLAARKRKFDSIRVVDGEKNKKTISLKGIIPKKSKEKKDKLKNSKPNQKRKSVSPNRSIRKLKSGKLKKSKMPESKKVLIHKRVISSDSEASTHKSSSSELSDSDSDDSTSMRSSLKTERNLDDIARERRQRVTKKDRVIVDSGLTHNRSAIMNTFNRSHAMQNYKEHRRKRFIEEREDDERPKKRFVSCVVKPRSEGRYDVLLSNRTVKDYHREKQWSSSSEASNENRPTDRQSKHRHDDRRKQPNHDARTRINTGKLSVTGHRETFKSTDGRTSPAVNVTFNSEKTFQKERQREKLSVLERLGAPMMDGGRKRPISLERLGAPMMDDGRKRPISPSSGCGPRRQVVSYDADYPASTGENARKRRRTEKDDDSASVGLKKSSQSHKSSISATKESSRRNTSKSKDGGDDELDYRIRKIQEKNAAILKRKQEVERDRKIYG